MTAQVLSKNLLDTNELLKNHQVQVQTLGDKLKVVEDEKALIADKLANAQRDMLSRDTSMLQLKTEVHALQQVSTLTSYACHHLNCEQHTEGECEVRSASPAAHAPFGRLASQYTEEC
jgi:hypothetical protein